MKNNDVSVKALLFILGLAALIGGITSVFKFRKYGTAEAVISRVEITEEIDEGDGEENVTFATYVNYTVDGKAYSDVKLDYYENGYEEGRTITIRYNPEAPEEVASMSRGLGAWLIIIGPVLMFAGAYSLFRKH